MDLLAFGVAAPWVLMAGGCVVGFALLRQGSRMVERLEMLEEALEDVQDDLLASKVESMQALPAGAEAPAFELPDLDGRRVSLEQFRGQRVLLVFFSPTCPICQEMAPELSRLPLGGGLGQPIPVVVTVGDPEANRALISEHGIRCPVLLDEDNAVTMLYKPEGTPAAYLVDEVGLVAKERADGSSAVLDLAARSDISLVEPHQHEVEPAAEAAVASAPGGESREGQVAVQREVHVPMLRGLPQEGIGVGDLVKRMTDAMGIKACRGCERRRQKWNRWVLKGKSPRGVIKGSDPTIGGT